VRREVAPALDGLRLEADGIYSSHVAQTAEQADEIRLREAVAAGKYPDLLDEVARHHSIRVMDRELRLFLEGIPRAGVVADIGGGWGWHWRHLDRLRPDICVVLVDFVRENLAIAARMLGGLVSDQVYLVHGDATALPFPSALFDGYWSVQALQHVPRFEQAVAEAHRILRPGGEFACYALNRAALIEVAYRVAGRPYHVHGKRPGTFYLSRASAAQKEIIKRIFASDVKARFTEILFHPDLRLKCGREGSLLGRIDARLSGSTPLWGWIARQRSYHVCKSA